MNKTIQAVIVSAVRTPMGSFQGIFSSISATKLGSLAIAEILNRVHLSGALVDEVYMGCVLAILLAVSSCARTADSPRTDSGDAYVAFALPAR